MPNSPPRPSSMNMRFLKSVDLFPRLKEEGQAYVEEVEMTESKDNVYHNNFRSKKEFSDSQNKLSSHLSTASKEISAIIVAIAQCFCFVFIMFEFYNYRKARPNVHNFEIDQHTDQKVDLKMRVVFNITVFDSACDDMSFDYQNVMGTREIDVTSNIFKKRLNPDGSPVVNGETANTVEEEHVLFPDHPGIHHRNATDSNAKCGSCYGALPEGECCDTCADVLFAYRRKRWQVPRIEQLEQCKGDVSATDLEESKGDLEKLKNKFSTRPQFMMGSLNRLSSSTCNTLPLKQSLVPD